MNSYVLAFSLLKAPGSIFDLAVIKTRSSQGHHLINFSVTRILDDTHHVLKPAVSYSEEGAFF